MYAVSLLPLIVFFKSFVLWSVWDSKRGVVGRNSSSASDKDPKATSSKLKRGLQSFKETSSRFALFAAQEYREARKIIRSQIGIGGKHFLLFRSAMELLELILQTISLNSLSRHSDVGFILTMCSVISINLGLSPPMLISQDPRFIIGLDMILDMLYIALNGYYQLFYAPGRLGFMDMAPLLIPIASITLTLKHFIEFNTRFNRLKLKMMKRTQVRRRNSSLAETVRRRSTFAAMNTIVKLVKGKQDPKEKRKRRILFWVVGAITVSLGLSFEIYVVREISAQKDMCARKYGSCVCGNLCFHSYTLNVAYFVEVLVAASTLCGNSKPTDAVSAILSL